MTTIRDPSNGDNRSEYGDHNRIATAKKIAKIGIERNNINIAVAIRILAVDIP